MEPTDPLTILGDGTAWIWRAATEHFPAAEQIPDIFHATRHSAAAAVMHHGEGTPAARGWQEAGRSRLLADG